MSRFDVDQSASDRALADRVLADRAAAGDRAALNELLEGHRPRMVTAARRFIPEEANAEDAVQEALLDAYRGLKTYDPRRPFRNWLRTIVVNRCRGWLRKESRRLDRPEPTSQAAANLATDDAGDPVAALEAKQRAARVREALGRLPAVQAEALRLRFHQGLLFREIAEAMGCSLLTAKNRVKWGLLRLATELRALQHDDRLDPRESP